MGAIRITTEMVDDQLQSMKAKKPGQADQVVRAIHQAMDSIQEKIDASNSAVKAAQAKVNEWVKTQKIAAEGKGDKKRLRARAKMADGYANAMSIIASSAVDKAAKAALEALLAHYDADVSR